jgi:hypothetical protein
MGSMVQSRPIPEAKDRENHGYVSVGHQQMKQMMTDAIKPWGYLLGKFYSTITDQKNCTHDQLIHSDFKTSFIA